MTINDNDKKTSLIKDKAVVDIATFSDNVLKLQRRKRIKKTRVSIHKPGNDLLKQYQIKTSQFRTVALAMQIGCAMNEDAGKFQDPDIEIDSSYTGLLHKYTGGKVRFQKLIQMVIRMLKVIKAFSKHASDTGRPVLVEQMKKQTLCVPQHPAFFDPKLFKLREFQYHIDPEARDILQLPWMNRTDGQVEKVWSALRHLKQFRCMTVTMQHTMSKYARYEHHSKNRTIVRKGDPGRHYYFIYSGKVVLMNSNVETDDECVSMGPGQDFGHVALLHMEKRTATLMCSEDTEFIVLDRRGNGRAVFRALHMEHKRKRKFLKTLDMFNGLSELEYRGLSDHARITEYLPMALVATVSSNHPSIYIVMEGTANVCLKTDVYSCCIPDESHRQFIAKAAAKRRCQHKSEPLHDTFTNHDPTLTVVIQRLKQGHIFGAQHLLHNKSNMPDLHLIAQSKLTVLTLPVYSVMHYIKPFAITQMQEKYPIYPSIKELMREYMESSIWDLYKAYVIRDLLHFDGRVDPSKKCKYCLSCQLRSLMLPNILPDTLREEVSDFYCPGNVSPLPSLACQTFRPKSAPPSIRERLIRHSPCQRRTPDFRYTSRTPSPHRNSQGPTLDCRKTLTSKYSIPNERSIPADKSMTKLQSSVYRPASPGVPHVHNARSYISSPDNDSINYNNTGDLVKRSISFATYSRR